MGLRNKREGPFLEAVSQGQSVLDMTKKIFSRTTGDCASRLAPLALKALTCGFGGLEGMTGCGGRERTGQTRARTCPPPATAMRLLCALGGIASLPLLLVFSQKRVNVRV